MFRGWAVLTALGLILLVACSQRVDQDVPSPSAATPVASATSAPPIAFPAVSPTVASSPVPTPMVAPAATPTPGAQGAPASATPAPTPSASPTRVPSPTPTPTRAPSPTPTPRPVFPSGIYFRLPRLDQPSGMLTRLQGPLVMEIEMAPSGFALRPDRLVFTDNRSTIVLVSPDGKRMAVQVTGLYQMARPTFSPDGTRVAVQASEDPQAPPNSLDVYVVELSTRQWKKISSLPVNDESPCWFPRSHTIAYSSFSPTEGITLHVYDVEAGREAMRIPDAGALSLAISPDETLVLNPSLMRVYDLRSGQMVRDLKPAVTAGLRVAGYEEDTRFSGQANRGTLTLDGGFSPDGKSILFDGAVKRGDQYGVVLAKVNLDGTGFEVLRALTPVTPAFSNNNNYSQMNPVWLP